MKRILALILACCLCVALVGCGAARPGMEETTEATESKPTHPKFQDVPIVGGNSGCMSGVDQE